jgi:cytochrome b
VSNATENNGFAIRPDVPQRRWFIRSTAPPRLRYEWPHRLWHWAFATTLCLSLGTGLADDVDLMDLHVDAGVVVIALLLFRLGWAFWGGPYVRIVQYRTSPRRIWAHFTRALTLDSAHTAPGAALALAVWWIVAAQAATGLFASDDIFTDGPFAHYLDAAGVDAATAVHTRLFWLVIALIAAHVGALAWYTFKRDPLTLAMLNGRAHDALPPVTSHYAARALVTALGVAALIGAAAYWL